jgi:hypothetical protein
LTVLRCLFHRRLFHRRILQSRRFHHAGWDRPNATGHFPPRSQVIGTAGRGAKSTRHACPPYTGTDTGCIDRYRSPQTGQVSYQDVTNASMGFLKIIDYPSNPDKMTRICIFTGSLAHSG